jgi:peptidyl-prolyl cis-trans isomerase C
MGILNFFKGNKMTNKVSAQHILVDQEFEATDILKKIEAGEEFEKLAADFSNCPSGKQGGNLGEFGKGMMVAPFEKAAFELEIGAVSAPVKTQFGYHIIKRLS